MSFRAFYQQTQGLFSAMGGALSLFLGIAAVMAFELLELVFDLCIEAWDANSDKGQVRAIQQ